MKVAVIGGGSTYTPELVNGFLQRQEMLSLRELWLMDVSEERLEVVGGFAQRMAENAPFKVHLTSDQREAIKGADYVITQVRVGGMEARRADEYLGQRYGLVGQETTGVGGMAKALRTIPVILQVARHMQMLAPDAMLLNFANPAGLVTEAVTRYAPSITTIGVCNGPFSIERNLLDILKRRGKVDPTGKESFMQVLGLNHLSWSYGMMLDGEDHWDEVMSAYLEELEGSANAHIPFDRETIEALHMVPSAYLQYYYYTQKKVEAQANWPPSRAEQVMQMEEDLLKEYADPTRTTPPDGLMKRGGAYYSTVATQFINAHANNLGEIHTVNVRHNGVVAGWDDDWVLEMPARISSTGVHPIAAEPLPPSCYGLVAQVKMYELLTVEAAIEGDRRAAHQALLAHPLGPPADQVGRVLDDLLQTHHAYLPQFWE